MVFFLPSFCSAWTLKWPTRSLPTYFCSHPIEHVTLTRNFCCFNLTSSVGNDRVIPLATPEAFKHTHRTLWLDCTSLYMMIPLMHAEKHCTHRCGQTSLHKKSWGGGTGMTERSVQRMRSCCMCKLTDAASR